MLLAVLMFGLGSLSYGQQALPNTGQQITPLAPTGSAFVPLNPGLSDNPEYLAGQAATSVVSPDGRTLLVLTSGYNLVKNSSDSVIAGDSTQFVFVYDISRYQPVQKQVLSVPDTYYGIVFDPSGTAFYVSGGVNDNVHIFSLGNNGVWAESASSPVALGHLALAVPPLNLGGVGLEVKPQAAGIAISADGAKLVVTNYYNDSISVLTQTSPGVWAVASELDLRPGKINPADSGVPGGEYPFWVVIKGSNTAYVSSIRDREIDVVDISTPTSPTLTTRLSLPGQPNKMVLNARQTTLYAAQDVSDSVAVIDTNSNSLVDNILVTAPSGLLPQNESTFKGNNTNSVMLSRDERSLYVTNGAMNEVAVVQLGGRGMSQVIGLIPTGWYPNSISFSNDGRFMYVVNDKSPTGPNPGYCHVGDTPTSTACGASNQYDLQLIKAGLQSFPTPMPGELFGLTQQVATNNNLSRRLDDRSADMMAFLRGHIHHIIYIIKENRTYDQVLGDLGVGNGDPSLTEFGSAVTPNLHNLASQFVDLDNFYDTSEVSMDGWPWSTAAHATDVVERQTSVEYASRGLSYDSEGTNRNVNVSYPTLAEREAADPATPPDPDVLPGTMDTAAPDGPQGQVGAGFLWDAALRAGLTVRNYGFFIDEARYNEPAPLGIPEIENPYATSTVVAYPTSVSLRPYTDQYFRGFDMTIPDYWRFEEWQRDFTANGLQTLTLLRLPHDHTGNYSIALGGITTPELDEADNDYAVGLVVQTIANSAYANDTLIFSIEDDAQDGGDHVDAHRSIAFIVGPYVKQGAVISTSYNTLSMFRTIEDILGIGYQNLNDALALPMADVFDKRQKEWTFTAAPSGYLCATILDLPPTACDGVARLYPTHDAAYWAKVTKGMDFSREDRVDGQEFNRILWQGLKGSQPYPDKPSGLDLRANRQQLLERYRAEQRAQSVSTVESTASSGGGGQ
jgi:DNA-binding beta-propeller fold protein YncE